MMISAMNGQPIKVLHLIPTLSSGGAERQLVNLVANTSKQIIEHVVCIIGEADFFAPAIRQVGHKVIELNVFAKRPFFQAARKFRKIVREEKPDIIHSWLYDANISARLAVFPGGKIPIITSLQLPDYEPEAIRIGGWNPHKVRGLKAIDKVTARLAKPYFVPCSQFVKDSYQRHFGIDESKTQVIYNSVDPAFLTASEDDAAKLRSELGLSAEAFVYLNVGRLDPQKNHKILLEAFRQVLPEIPNAVLLLAGVGDSEKELKNLSAELRLDEKVIFLGRRSDIGALLELADVFVFPSNFEGLGVALVEATFKSLPCIASRLDVINEIITDRENGLLIDQTSAAELKDAMIELYKNTDLRSSLGSKAFQTAEANFRADETAKEWEELYRKVSSKSGKSE